MSGLAFSPIDFDVTPFEDNEFVNLLCFDFPVIPNESNVQLQQYTNDVTIPYRQRKGGSSSSSTFSNVTIHVEPLSENVKCLKKFNTTENQNSEKRICVNCQFFEAKQHTLSVVVNFIQTKRLIN